MQKINVNFNNLKFGVEAYLNRLESFMYSVRKIWFGVYKRDLKFYLYIKVYDKYQISFNFSDINNLIGFLTKLCDFYSVELDFLSDFESSYPRERLKYILETLEENGAYCNSNIEFNRPFSLTKVDKLRYCKFKEIGL